jgi:putative ABC transport system permease protein
MSRVPQDVRYALRTLGKSPGFTAVAVLTLALGIGANGAVASVVRALLLRPLPYAHQERLVGVWSRWSDFSKTWLSVPEYRTLIDSGCFSGLALFDSGQVNLTGGSEPERVGSASISANLFTVLGVQPRLGRAFTAAEVGEQPARVVILSEELWRRRFGAQPNLVGTSVDIDGVPRTVVGIVPAGLKLPADYTSQTPSALWLPLDENLTGAYTMPARGGSHNYTAIGRLRPGLPLAAAEAQLRRLADRLTASGVYPPTYHFGVLLNPVVSEVLGPLRVALLVLCGAVGFVLLIACANVANLLLARGMQRRKEFALRMALGATPGRLARQLLVEGGALAAVGGVLGLWMSALAVRLLRSFQPADIPRLREVAVDGGVVAFVLLIALATPLLFGLAPALEFAQTDLQARLQQGSRSTTGGREGRRFQSVLVAAAVGLSMVLLMGASLMVRTSRALSRVDPGFRTDHVLTLTISPSRVKVPRAEKLIALYETLLAGIRRLPGVEAAGAVRNLPLTTEMGDWGMQVEGYAPPPGERVAGGWQIVTPGYFEAMRIPVVAGRVFTDLDRRDAQPVIVISASMAHKFWPGADPLGRRIRIGGTKDAPFRSVVGVVGDVRHDSLTAQVRETWYLTQSQVDLSIGFRVDDMTLAIKTAGDPAAIAAPVRALIRAIDPELPASAVRPLAAVAAEARSKQRFTMQFLAICSALAMILAAGGISSVVRARVISRYREIGLHMALGARRGQVIGKVVSQSMGAVVAGLALGAVTALGLSQFLSALLYGVRPHDLATLAVAGAGLALVALAASYLPARRAASVDPLVVLREE